MPPLIVRTTLVVPMTVLKVGVVKFAAKALGTGLRIPISKPKLAMGTKSFLILRDFGTFIYTFLLSRCSSPFVRLFTSASSLVCPNRNEL